MNNQKVALGFFVCPDVHAVIVLSSSKPIDNYPTGADGQTTTWVQLVVISFNILAQARVEPAEKGRCERERWAMSCLSTELYIVCA